MDPQAEDTDEGPENNCEPNADGTRVVEIASAIRRLRVVSDVEGLRRSEHDRRLIVAAVHLGLIRYNEETGLAEVAAPNVPPTLVVDGVPVADADVRLDLQIAIDDIHYALQRGELQSLALSELGIGMAFAGRGFAYCGRIALQFGLYARGLVTEPVRDQIGHIAEALIRAREPLAPSTQVWVWPLVQIFESQLWAWEPLWVVRKQRSLARRVLTLLEEELGEEQYGKTPFLRADSRQIEKADEYLGAPFDPKGGKGGRPVTPYEAARRFAGAFDVKIPRSSDAKRPGKSRL